MNVTQYDAVAGGVKITAKYTVDAADFPIGNLNIINTFIKNGSAVKIDNPDQPSVPWYDGLPDDVSNHINGNTVTFSDAPIINPGPPYSGAYLDYNTYFVWDKGIDANLVHQVVVYDGISWGVTVLNNNLPGSRPQVQSVPEPAAFVLTCVGGILVAGFSKWRPNR